MEMEGSALVSLGWERGLLVVKHLTFFLRARGVKN